MKLETYLAERKIRKRAFAEEIGVTPSLITDYVKGRREPSLATMRKIAVATGGAVKPNDFLYPDQPRIPPTKKEKAA